MASLFAFVAAGVLSPAVRNTEPSPAGHDTVMPVVWIVITVFLTGGAFLCCLHVRSSSNSRRSLFARRSRSVHPDSEPSSHAFPTTTYVVRPSGVTIAVITAPSTPRRAVLAVTQNPALQPRPSVKLDGFDAPSEVAEESCAICLSPLAEQSVSSASCSHLIHTTCYNAWLAKDAKQACPICRQPVHRPPPPTQPS